MLHVGVVILRKMFSKKYKIAPLVLVILTLNFASVVEALEPFQLYTEGSCDKFRAGEASDVNRTVLDEFRFIASGSRYMLLRGASAHPRYESMSEEEFLNSYCPQRNTTSRLRRSVASAFGFGRVLSTYDVRTPSPDEKSDVFVEAISRKPSESWDILRQTVAFTDNRNYAFLVNCWTGSDQAAWTVISRTPTLTTQGRRFVRDSVRALKFNAENIVHLTNEDCQVWSASRRDRDNSRILRRLQSRNNANSATPSQKVIQQVQSPKELNKNKLPQAISSTSFVRIYQSPSPRQTQLVRPEGLGNVDFSQFGTKIRSGLKLSND